MKANGILARRLREVRLEMYGEHGGPLMAEALGLTFQTWSNYESGVTMHGLVLFRFIELKGVEHHWLLTGEGQKVRPAPVIEKLRFVHQVVRGPEASAPR